jgi:uncharacterized protein YbjQ (UPF0145 family)
MCSCGMPLGGGASQNTGGFFSDLNDLDDNPVPSGTSGSIITPPEPAESTGMSIPPLPPVSDQASGSFQMPDKTDPEVFDSSMPENEIPEPSSVDHSAASIQPPVSSGTRTGVSAQMSAPPDETGSASMVPDAGTGSVDQGGSVMFELPEGQTGIAESTQTDLPEPSASVAHDPLAAVPGAFHVPDPSYTIIIDDVRKPEDRQVIMRVFSDQRLGVDPNIVSRQLETGRLAVSNLNEVIAARIMSALVDIDADVRLDLTTLWRAARTSKRPGTETRRFIQFSDVATQTMGRAPVRMEQVLEKSRVAVLSSPMTGMPVKRTFGIITSMGRGRVARPSGKTSGYKIALDGLMTTVLNDLRKQALKKGANAVVNVKMNYRVVPESGSALLIILTAYGTAVALGTK